jgi:hypothetical protein
MRARSTRGSRAGSASMRIAALPALCLLLATRLLLATQEPGAGGEAPGEDPTPGPASQEVAAAPRACRVDYDIAARLLRVEREDGGEILTRWRLEGQETIRWTNGSGEPVSDLWFHLYLNAFANSRSISMLGRRDGGVGRGRVDLAGEWWWGWQRVDALAFEGQDLLPSLSWESPHADEGAQGSGAEPRAEAPQDRTVFRVELPRPIEPGETAEIEVRWTSQLPRVRQRTGTKGDFLFVAQWFPKLGVYEAGRGWNCHTFHSMSEFFSDYGHYRVTLDMPKEYSERVGGGGVRTQDLVKGGQRVEVVFESPSRADRERPDAYGKLPLVHDFAWTADPDFVVYSSTFEFDTWAKEYVHEVELAQRAAGADVDLGCRDVAVTVLLQPEHQDQAERHFRATCAALFYYGLWYGEYPYEHITVLDPAWGAGAAGGMEYPTLFTCGTRMFAHPLSHSPEGVTVHECGHQFWYGLVGNNEFESAWLDEGFNTFTDGEVMARVYGRRHGTTSYLRRPHLGVQATRVPEGGGWSRILLGRGWDLDFLEGLWVLDKLSGVTLDPLRPSDVLDWWRDQPLLTLVPETEDPRWGDRAAYLRDPASDPVDTWSFRYADRQSYRVNSYQRTAVTLRSLAGLVGWESFLRGMRHYARKWRYGHPTPDDFFADFQEGAGVDVQWYFDAAFRSTKTIDWAVEVRQARSRPEVGYFPQPDGTFEEKLPASAREAGPREVVVDEAAAGAEPVAPAQPRPREDRAQVVEILLRRRGELCLPLPWRITIEHVAKEGERQLEDEVRDFVWTREEQLARAWTKLDFDLPPDRRVKSVVLDPERLCFFDLDMSDNQWFAERDRLAPIRWAERGFVQYQHLLHWFSGLGG